MQEGDWFLWLTTPVINTFLSKHLGPSSFRKQQTRMSAKAGDERRGEWGKDGDH